MRVRRPLLVQRGRPRPEAAPFAGGLGCLVELAAMRCPEFGPEAEAAALRAAAARAESRPERGRPLALGAHDEAGRPLIALGLLAEEESAYTEAVLALSRGLMPAREATGLEGVLFAAASGGTRGPRIPAGEIRGGFWWDLDNAVMLGFDPAFMRALAAAMPQIWASACGDGAKC